MNFKRYFLVLSLFFSILTKPSLALDLPSIESFAQHQKFYSIKLSPDGKHFSASMDNESGKRIVAIFNRDSGKITGVFNFKGSDFPIDAFWLNNERVAVNLGKKLGARAQPFPTGEVVAMNVDGKKRKMIFGMRAEESSRAGMRLLDLIADDPKNILIEEVGLRSRAFKLNVYTGRKVKAGMAPPGARSMIADNKGVIRFASGQESIEGKNYDQIYYRNGASEEWQLIDTIHADKGRITPLAFSKDENKVYVRSDKTSKTSGIYLYDIKTKVLEEVFVHPVVDVGSLDIDRKNNLFAVHHEADYSHVEVLDKEHPLGRWYPTFIKTFKGAKVRINSTTDDMSEFVITVQSDKNPGTFYLFDTKTKKLVELFKAKPGLDSSLFGTTEAFKLKARDGLEIYGYLTLPNGKESNLPLVIIPHGGPHGPRDYWTYDDDVQVLASRGYAVMKVNFRGSGGYGREFQTKGYRKWGSDIMTDLFDATNWAVKQGIVDKNRMCVYGASFGGYSALMTVVKEPDLYKCAIGYVGVYDMAILYDKGDIPTSEFGTNFLDKVIGHDEKQLHEFSPARHVEKIKADLFIVHGKEDIRAHYEHALYLKEQLDKKGIKYEWMAKDKEGHGFYDPKNRQELYERMLAFLDKNIGEKSQ
ncbi:alpha/beta hydrolase family protein [Colwelliaceae bacterium 6441]